jgi:FkbM family methyltransferase
VSGYSPKLDRDFLVAAIGGQEIFLDGLDGRDFVAREFAEGRFERPLPAVFAAALRRVDGGFVDVGANNGLYSLIAGTLRPDLSIDAFEPFPPAIEVLRRNIARNELRDRIHVHEIALSDEGGPCRLHIPITNYGFLDASCSLQDDFQRWNKTLEITRRRLDDVELAAPPSIIKADIEGHEHAFIAGAWRTLTRCHPMLILEVLSSARLEILESQRHRLGFVDVRLKPELAIVGQPVIFDPDAWNHVWVRPEGLDAFLALVQGLGLAVTE